MSRRSSARCGPPASLEEANLAQTRPPQLSRPLRVTLVFLFRYHWWRNAVTRLLVTDKVRKKVELFTFLLKSTNQRRGLTHVVMGGNQALVDVYNLGERKGSQPWSAQCNHCVKAHRDRQMNRWDKVDEIGRGGVQLHTDAQVDWIPACDQVTESEHSHCSGSRHERFLISWLHPHVFIVWQELSELQTTLFLHPR